MTIALTGVNSLVFTPFISAAHAQDGGAMVRPDAEGTGINDLLTLLTTPDLEGWEDVEAKIRVEWSRSGSHSVDYLLHRAIEAMETDNMQAALEHATALTDHAPEFAEGWSMLAKAYFHSGYYGPALDALQRTVALNPAHFEAFSGLGVILDEMGEPEAALRAFQTSAAIHPHQPHISGAIEDLEARTSGEKI
ncbi:tetratricopeptide repeat protein [Halocynthiibacter styelae]|nr:tetratricopeptide repeat protein [Paenihalocynthiibacter styelae]